MGANVTGIYLQVVQDVINNVRADFQSEGVDEGLLVELQALWELKMMQSGAIQNTTETALARGGPASVTPVHDLNVPYEATEEYMSPTAKMLFQPTSLTNTAEPLMYHYLPPGPSEPATMLETGISGDVKIGRPSLYMQQPAPWMSQKPLDVNIAYAEGREEERHISQPPVTKDFFTLSTGKRKHEEFAPEYLSGSYIPQQDGAGDTDVVLASSRKAAFIHQTMTQGHALWTLQKNIGRNAAQDRVHIDSVVAGLMGSPPMLAPRGIPQFDGNGDNYDDVAEEDYNKPGEDDPQLANEVELKVPKAEGAESDTSEPPLNEDDDDDLTQGDEEPKTDHLVIAQFEKVTRSKNKWKCILKDGVMHLKQRDYLFSKANGEFEF